MLLTTLLIAFAILSGSEPTIASNQVRAAQARALAEAGLERAIWALGTTVSGGIAEPMLGTIATAPYDGGTYLPAGTAGGFRLAVRSGSGPTERMVEAVGLVLGPPSTGGANPSAVARRRLEATVARLRWLDPPAPFSVRGDLRIDANALVDARQDASCGPREGVAATGSLSGGGTVYGHGDDTDSGGPPDRVPGMLGAAFDDHVFSDRDLDLLRGLARCCGTYLTGDQAWHPDRRMPAHGLIFVDTPDGVGATLPRVTIVGDAAPAGSPEFRGWLVVNGSIEWSGSTGARGLVYAQKDVAVAGAATITGAVIARNVAGGDLSSIGAGDGPGHAVIRWDCEAARTGAGTVPTGWFVKAGTYREIAE
jgi:hypothetical protein